MQNIFTNIKCREIILSNANENWYIILYDLFSRLCYIATCGPICKDATHIGLVIVAHYDDNDIIFNLVILNNSFDSNIVLFTINSPIYIDLNDIKGSTRNPVNQ